MFLFLLFLHFRSCSISSLSLSVISFLPFSGRRHKMTHKYWCVVNPQHNKKFVHFNIWYTILIHTIEGGWSGGEKVSCTSGYQGVQLILAYSWARPAILVAGKGRRRMFLFLLFLHFHSCSSFFPVLSFIPSTISSISFLPVSGRRHKMTHKGWCVVKPHHNQSYYRNTVNPRYNDSICFQRCCH